MAYLSDLLLLNMQTRQMTKFFLGFFFHSNLKANSSHFFLVFCSNMAFIENPNNENFEHWKFCLKVKLSVSDFSRLESKNAFRSCCKIEFNLSKTLWKSRKLSFYFSSYIFMIIFWFNSNYMNITLIALLLRKLLVLWYARRH